MGETYVESLKVMTETLSKVGYGMPYWPLNALEMIFLLLTMSFNFNTLFMIFSQVSKLQKN